MALDDEFGNQLDELTDAPKLPYLVQRLIKKFQDDRDTDRLIRLLQVNKPDHPKIKNLVGDLRLLAVDGDAKLVGSSLERTVNERAGYANIASWQETLGRHQRRICRIEDSRVLGSALGTGFLVHHDLVLTNFHVVDKYVQGARDTTELKCRFDYAEESTGVKPGVLKGLAGPNWLVDYSPFSVHDPGDQGGTPQETELDYALIRLDQPAGDDEWSGGAATRGWIPLATAAPLPEQDDIIFIMQHPKGQPLKMAVGAVLKRNDNNTRFRYNANTDPGSSGSPCFNVRLDLVGIHHGGDPDSGQLARYNQGIPSERILRFLASRPAVPQFW